MSKPNKEARMLLEALKERERVRKHGPSIQQQWEQTRQRLIKEGVLTPAPVAQQEKEEA